MLLALALLVPARADEPAAKTVFLSPDAAGRPELTRGLERELAARGFKIVQAVFPGDDMTVESRAEALAQRVFERGEGDLYFIGHGAGAVVIRYYLARYHPKQVARFLMIAPPNRGGVSAEAAEGGIAYRLFWGDKSVRGPRVSRKDFWSDLPAPTVEFGVIAGGRKRRSGFNPRLRGDNDGELSVDEARLDGAKDFIVLPYRHDALLSEKEPVRQALRFLDTGRFDRKIVKRDPLAEFRPRWKDGQVWHVEYTEWLTDPSMANDRQLFERRTVWDYRLTRRKDGGWDMRVAPNPTGHEIFRMTEEYRLSFGRDLSLLDAGHHESDERGDRPVENWDPAKGLTPPTRGGVPILFWPDWSGRYPESYILEGDKVIFRWEGRAPVELRWTKGDPWWRWASVGQGRPGIQARLMNAP